MTRPRLREDAAELVRSNLTDPVAVVDALALERDRSQRGEGVMVICPAHAETRASCHIRRGRRDGTLTVRCYGCDLSGDVLALVAAAYGLDLSTGYADAIIAAAEIAGVDVLAECAASPPRSRPSPRPLRSAPPISPSPPPTPLNFSAISDVLVPVVRAPRVLAYIERRGLAAEAIADDWRALDVDELRYQIDERIAIGGNPSQGELGRAGLVRELDDGFAAQWPVHLLAIPWRLPDGRVELVQRRRLDAGDPRYVMPVGVRPSHPYGIEQLERRAPRIELVLVEGALDVLAFRALEPGERVVLGLAGLSHWRAEWAALARGRVVRIAFDADKPGDDAAERVAEDLYDAGAARVLRTRPRGAKDWTDMLTEAAA